MRFKEKQCLFDFRKRAIVLLILVFLLTICMMSGTALANESAYGYVWPIKDPSAPITAGWNYSDGDYHGATDIGVSVGTEVIAAKAGAVALTQGWDGYTTSGMQSYGNLIILNHPDGTQTYYAHLSQILVSNGQSVSQGQVIGRSGATGNVTGPHLHFEIRENGNRVDPQNRVSPNNQWEGVNHNPVGVLDIAEGGDGIVHVRGWAFDPDNPSASIEVHVYVGGDAATGCGQPGIMANQPREDVNAAYGITGNHGFDTTFSTPVRGQVYVYAYGLNMHGEGTNVQLPSPSSVFICDPKGNAIADLPDGQYALRSKLDSDYALDVWQASMEYEGNIAISPWNGGGNQKFTLSKRDDGSYTMVAEHSGFAVEVYGGSAVNGANVTQHGYNDTPAQRWFVERNDDGTYSFRNKVSGMYLDITSAEIAPGSNVWQYIGNGSDAQKWFLVPTAASSWDIKLDDQVFTGQIIAPHPVVTAGNLELAEDTDYTVNYENNGGIGIARATITGVGGFTGSVTKEFIIRPGDIKSARIEKIADCQFSGTVCEPSPLVTMNEKELEKDIDYTVEYSDNAKPGIATLTVIGMGNYTGVQSTTFRIVENEHVWGDWITDIDATCSLNGSRHRVCENCGELDLEEIPALGHDPLEATRQNEVAATCEQDGSYESVVVCSRCGEELSRETVKVDKLGHASADPVEENRVEPTCSAEGSRELVTYCGRCGEELGRVPETLPKAEHAPGDPVEENRVEPTCKNAGSYDLVTYCTVCGREVTREAMTVPKKDHEWGEGEITVPPTCTEPGERTFTCAGCGEKRTEGVEATGHRPGKPVTENESASNTCTEGGTYDEVVYCEVCHEELSREQKTQPAGQHVPVTDAAVAPTCTKAGLTEGSHCQVCGTVLVAQEPVAALGHEEEHVDAVAPSCTEPGATEGTRCATCGEVLSGCEPIAALGHNYREAVVEPTCMQAGHTEHRCTRCGDTYVTDRVPAKAHTASDPEVASEVPASCEAVGSRVLVTKCSDCGKELYRTTQTVPATGHTAGEPVVESETKATCEAPGRKVTVTKCADCERELTRTVEVTPATGHKAGEPVVESETPATCEKAGTRTLVTKCAGCGKELSRQTEAVPAKGHSWDEGRVTKEPTCTEQGLRAFTCTACGATTTERVPTADHRPGAESRENEVASTCSAPGHYEAVTHCADCGVELSRQTVPLPLGDHAWGSWSTVLEATYEREGMQIRTCGTCHLSETRSLPKPAGPARVSIASASVTVDAGGLAYTGRAHRPEVAVTLGGTALREGVDYALSYRDNVNAGTATVTVTGMGAYEGTATGRFSIATAAQAVTASNVTVDVGKTVALGARASGAGRLAYRSSNAAVATVGANGQVTGKSAGTTTVTVTAAATANHAAATRTVTVTVVGDNTLAAQAKKKTVTVKASKVRKKAYRAASNVGVSGAQGALSYANASTSKKAKRLKVDARTGRVTVPKGTKRGTYKLRVRVTAAGDATHRAASRVVSYSIKVK